MRIVLLLSLLTSLTFSASAQTPTDSAAVELLPQYPGGYQAFYKYLNDSTRLSPLVSSAGSQGAGVVSFWVDTTGLIRVDSINLDRVRFKKRRIDEATKAQARQAIRSELQRIFEGSPQWIPATRNGRPVRVKFSMSYTVQSD